MAKMRIITSAVTAVAPINDDDKSDGFHSASKLHDRNFLGNAAIHDVSKNNPKERHQSCKKKKYTLFINYNVNNGGP